MSALEPPVSSEFAELLQRLNSEASRLLYNENDVGARARSVVSAVAEELGLNLFDGTLPSWSVANMERVVVAAKQMRIALKLCGQERTQERNVKAFSTVELLNELIRRQDEPRFS